MTRKIFFISVCTLFIFASCGKKNSQNSKDTAPKYYPTMTVSPQKMTLESVYPVTIKGLEDVEIRPRIDGFVDKVFIDEGVVVKKGQPMFLINSPQSIQNLATAKAMVSSSQANLNTAKLNVDRMRPLAEKNIISEVQLQTYENQYEQAKADLVQAQAGLDEAQEAISWMNVESPVDGVVGTIPYGLGNLVNNQFILTYVSDASIVFANFSLNEKELLDLLKNYKGKTQAEKIKNIPPVTLIMANGTVYPEQGKIQTISGLIIIETGSVNIRAEFPNKNGLLRAGSSGQVLVPRELDSVFAIPQKATFNLQDKILVYKVQGDSVVQTVITAEATRDGQQYAVTGGLKAGDQIVTDGIATLSNGKKIKTTKE
ncbi:MAG: efflux RND transporter periplasmic adaptor subunit [Prevotellaceae bacterium]|jgi:membrane fusion protein (multidrug efflux system)|nr:efflux RND transporter periplasmic adaptor subunit [Prevotellaceae bacterium]